MSTITRNQVQSQLQNREVAVADLQARTEVPADVRAKMAEADLDKNGVITGTQEVDALFKAADDFDTNGDRNSIATEARGLPTPQAAGLQAAIASSKPRRGLSGTNPRQTITREEVQQSLQGKEVSVAGLQNAPGIDATTASKIARADSNRDGLISGRSEVDGLFNAVDDLDSNGNRNSVAGTSNGANSAAANALDAVVERAQAKSTVTRSDVQANLRGKEVPLDALDANTRAALGGADLNSDGVIAGNREVDRMFNVADDLDTNGKRDSLVANANGAATAAGTLLENAGAVARTSTVAQPSGPTNLDDSYRVFRDVDVGKLRDALPSQARHLAEAFVNAGREHNVDPLLLVSISKHETANWTSSAFRNKNNAMGVSNSSGPRTMSSAAESIDYMARRIGSTTEGYYKNANSYRDLWSIYAPGPATGQSQQRNDPGNLNRHWGPNIVKNIDALAEATS